MNHQTRGTSVTGITATTTLMVHKVQVMHTVYLTKILSDVFVTQKQITNLCIMQYLQVGDLSSQVSATQQTVCLDEKFNQES